ncbi:MAG: alanine racemase [Spirochaeta sp.]|nr:alanine racemase [Spirochaeta sp.]
MIHSAVDRRLTWAEVDLDALAANIHSYRHHVGKGVAIIAVVKANAYGHGAVAVSRAALEAGASRLAVHRLEEGIELRQAGISCPILIMGYTPVSNATLVVAHQLTAAVTTREFARALNARALNDRAETPIPIHIKVDSGMGRFGLLPGEAADFAAGLGDLRSIKIEGIFTHFATADALDQFHMQRQLAVFKGVLAEIESRGLKIAIRHACNSAAAMTLPEGRFEAVRPGLSLYGMVPSSEWPPPFALQPVLSLKSRVVRLRTLAAGSSIGYGRTYVTKEPTRVALLPVGYGDGYHRLISGRGAVLLKGKRAPILGRVSMDQIVVDVSAIPGVELEEEATLLGGEGDAAISAEEIAGWAQTINYEITTSLLPRVARLYRRNGEIIGAHG